MLAGLTLYLVRAPGGRDGFSPLAIDILVVAVLLRILWLFTPPSLSDDVYRYLWDGRVQKAGIDPYTYPPAAPALAALRNDAHALINHPSLRTPYPPLAQLSFRLGAAVSETVFAQKALAVVFDLAAVALLLALLWTRGQSAAWAALYAWHPLPVVEFAGSGHIDSLMIALLLAAVWFYERRRTATSGLWFGLAVTAKWIPVVMAPWLSRRGHLKAIVLYLLAIVAFCSLFSTGLRTMAAGLVNAGVSGAQDWVFNPSVYGLLALIVAPPAARKVVVGGVLLVFSFWWASRKDEPAGYLHGVLWALLILSPVAYPWYVTWLLPFAVLVRERVAFAWAWAAAFTYLVHGRFAATGVWVLPRWVPWFEYGLLVGFSVRRFVAFPRIQRRAQ